LAKSDIEPKPKPKIQLKPEPKIEPKPEPKIEPKPEPKIEPKPPVLRNVEKNKALRKSKQYENIKNKKKVSPKAQIKPPKAKTKPKISNQSKVGSTMDAISKKSIRVDAKKIDDLINQVGELVVSRAWFSQLYSEMRTFQQFLKEKVKLDQKNMKHVRGITFRLSEATVALGRVANELQEGVMRVRMLPIAQLFNRYPRLVRDLTHNSDKMVRLEVKGEDTELDKMIIEEISDPLIHIIRNAVDHGIETATERRRANKTEAGRLILEAYHESNHVVIEVSDDGRGINPEKIKATAIKRELLGADELNLMPDKELTALITIPGFSTAAQVTTTSGRGVGMDVVKKNIEKLNGTLEIDSKVGAYTRFRIKIPLTLAIIPALLVKVGVELYTIPLAAVEETLRIYSKDTTTIEGTEVIYVRNMTLPLVRLSEIFGIPSRSDSGSKEFVVIVNTGLKKIGLVVDALIGQEEVVIKPLEDYLQEKSGFSGATILGDGRISLILDVYELANISIKRLISKRKVRI
jgi:two-component system chemotaxis sensor kinase CheA